MSFLGKISKYLIIIALSAPAIVHAEDQAEQYFDAGEWLKAADAYTARTQSDPTDVASWFRLAVSLRHAERYAQAREALAEAERRQFSPVRVRLERARLQVLGGESEAAISELKAVLDAGFTGVGLITGDPVLGQLEGVPGFAELTAEMSRLAYPCEHDPAFSAFDFWLGDWDVHVANGTYAGSNSIRRSERGCVLVENWRSATGGTGASINYLDGITGEWVQIWNDAAGSQIQIRGGMSEEGMRLSGSIHYLNNGTTAGFRGLWTPLPDGRVRQFFEQQSADGETWSPWFEGFYSRKPAN